MIDCNIYYSIYRLTKKNNIVDHLIVKSDFFDYKVNIYINQEEAEEEAPTRI